MITGEYPRSKWTLLAPLHTRPETLTAGSKAHGRDHLLILPSDRRPRNGTVTPHVLLIRYDLKILVAAVGSTFRTSTFMIVSILGLAAAISYWGVFTKSPSISVVDHRVGRLPGMHARYAAPSRNFSPLATFCVQDMGYNSTTELM